MQHVVCAACRAVVAMVVVAVEVVETWGDGYTVKPSFDISHIQRNLLIKKLIVWWRNLGEKII